MELEKLLAAAPDYKRQWFLNVVEARARRARKLGLVVDLSKERNLMQRFFGGYKRQPDPKEDIAPDTGEDPNPGEAKRDSPNPAHPHHGTPSEAQPQNSAPRKRIFIP